MITLDNVSYTYRGGMNALDGVTAEIGPGIQLLVGENGAGKTTLLHVIAGLLKPTVGECLVDGQPIALRRPSDMNRIFLLPDNDMPTSRSVWRMADTIGGFYTGFDRDFLRDALAEFGLDGTERFDRLSLGNRRKSLLAFAMSLGTDTLLLDEPANGLDIAARLVLRTLLMRWTAASPTRTVIVSTHTVTDVESIVDGLILLRRNQLLLSASCEQLLRRLAFVHSAIPVPGALFSMPDAGMFRSIVPAGAEIESDLDPTALFVALNSPSAQAVLDILNTNEPVNTETINDTLR